MGGLDRSRMARPALPHSNPKSLSPLHYIELAVSISLRVRIKPVVALFQPPPPRSDNEKALSGEGAPPLSSLSPQVLAASSVRSDRAATATIFPKPQTQNSSSSGTISPSASSTPSSSSTKGKVELPFSLADEVDRTELSSEDVTEMDFINTLFVPLRVAADYGNLTFWDVSRDKGSASSAGQASASASRGAVLYLCVFAVTEDDPENLEAATPVGLCSFSIRELESSVGTANMRALEDVLGGSRISPGFMAFQAISSDCCSYSTHPAVRSWSSGCGYSVSGECAHILYFSLLPTANLE